MINNINTLEDVIKHLSESSQLTPAGGRSFTSSKLDICATVYPNKIRLFYNRNNTVKRGDLIPALFLDEKEIKLA